MATTIKHKRSSVSDRVPTVSDLELGELAINTYDGNIFLKRRQGNDEAILTFLASNPVRNVIYVQKDGNDSNSGTSWDSAYATIEQAVDAAWDRVGEITLIEIGPGEYTSEGHIDVPDDVIIRGAHRSVIIRPEPGFEERNVFRLGSGCFVEGLVFDNWRLDSLDDPTEGFAFCFRQEAVIRRAPYIHKVVVRTTPFWDTVAPPLDRNNQNPLIGRGAGVILADGAVCSRYSIYPNIMAWGATPVSHNGIGYVAKNGGLINAVNAICMWAHKHFLALDGGQIILSSCSTQFGDYTMVADGSRSIVLPREVADGSLTVQTAASTAVNTIKTALVEDAWDDLVAEDYTTGWSQSDEIFFRREATTLIQSLIWVLQTANEKPMLDFAKGLFNTLAEKTYVSQKEPALIHMFQFIRDTIIALPGVNSASDTIVTNLITALLDTIQNTRTVLEPSTITAIGHTWTALMAGVALTKIPPAKNQATIEESILELNNGIVIASGQDDQGSALFIGGMKIDADTGELTGPPFEQSVNRIATRAAIARSF